MADEALVSGTEKLQVEDAQKTEKVNASEKEKNIVPEKLQCDSSESGSDSGLEKEKDAALVKGGGQGEKKKKEVLKKKKKGSKKNEVRGQHG